MNEKIYPVILAGGIGTRLWPLSRKSFPKQFVKLWEKESLFQKSAKRLMSSKHQQFADQIIITSEDYRFIVSEQLEAVGIQAGEILIEPEGKNTAPAVLAACMIATSKDPNAILIISPSDHIIKDHDSFQKAINEGARHLEEKNIITFSIIPDRPETGYGYLELENGITGQPCSVRSFVEKPNLQVAKEMLLAGNYHWNSGIFMFRAKDMVKAFKEHCKELVEPVRESILKGEHDLDFFRLAAAPWSKCNNISIDYAIMEKTQSLVSVPLRGEWSDLGGWDAVWREQLPDENGIVSYGSATSIDCSNSLLRSESPDIMLVGLGLENIIAVAMSDAVFIAHKDKAQEVRDVVTILRNNFVPQAEKQKKQFRPWGWLESLVAMDGFEIKRLNIKPGGVLGLQSHTHRSENWVVVEGIGTVTVNEEVSELTEGQSIAIPPNAIHRIENNGSSPLTLIEIRTGKHLEEADITRYENVYLANK